MPRLTSATEIARELLRLGPDATGLARELREILTDTTDDLPMFGDLPPRPGSVNADQAGREDG